ncbi:MAG: class I SAM-dependent methyltransferase [Candidatus Heimdallarchaeota archaeon]|nr:class I SAM-dependent methyltransferase [Candidatus Heimdallarchaeota archaeon]
MHSEPVRCYYCDMYHKLSEEVPINEAKYDPDSLTPRCEVHFQFMCDYCHGDYHFNGISFCASCKTMTCIKCGHEAIIKKDFLIYNYYYEIKCKNCDSANPALDYAEFALIHPYQLGFRKPKDILQVWLPFNTDIVKCNVVSGHDRLLAFNPVIKVSTGDDTDSRKTWNQNADKALENDFDVHHEMIIIPNVLELLELNKNDIVLDLGCGGGNVARKVAGRVSEITGIDYSENMLVYATKREEEHPLGIIYHHLDATNLTSLFSEGQFTKIFANMSIMDMDNLSKILSQIYLHLTPGGIFVFSITHPCFTWPITRSVKLPKDSQRNEDKTVIVENYLNEGPTKVEIKYYPAPMLYYTRTVSTYVNTLLKTGFQLIEIREPKVDQNLIEKYPRDFYNDQDKIPMFMIFKLKKPEI